MDKPLWGITKGKVAMHCYHKNDKLWRAVKQAFTAITPQILWCMSHRTCSASGCLECDNAHTNPLDIQQLSPNEGVKWSRPHCTITSLFTHCLLYQLCKYDNHTFFLSMDAHFLPSPPLAQTENAWELWKNICLEGFIATTSIKSSQPVRRKINCLEIMEAAISDKPTVKIINNT